MKLTAYAVAAYIIGTPVAAQEVSCDKTADGTYVEKHTYGPFVISQAIDIPNNKFLIGFESVSPQIKSIVPTSDKPFAFDLDGNDSQSLTPMGITAEGKLFMMETLFMRQVRETFDHMVLDCTGEAPAPKTPVHFPTMPGTFTRLKLNL